MSTMIGRLFVEHPRSVGESYFEHQVFAFGFAMRLFAAGFAAFVHAVLPFAFETTASRMVREMAEELTARRRIKA